MAGMRVFGILALSVALQATALSAPLVHEHPDDATTDHHHGRTVHSHWAGHQHDDDHSTEGPTLTAVDHDRAIFFSSFVAVKEIPAPAPALSFETFELSTPPEQRPYRAIEVVRSHDPPVFQSLCSRAPPSCLS
jgi:hypothetical protein